ncbi:uncharacterized protein LOC120348596 [Styela clava]
MATLMSETRTQDVRLQRRRRTDPQHKNRLTGEVRYTSLHARKACLELGIPTNQLASVGPRPPKHKKEKPEKSFVTSYCRSLRLKSKKRRPAAATVIIGRLRSDYVTITSQVSHKSVTSRNRRYSESKAMTKSDIKGILSQTKQTENNKRVTFNEQVEIEEFKPASAIIEQTKSAGKKNDVTKKNNYESTKNNNHSGNTHCDVINDVNNKKYNTSNESNKSNNDKTNVITNNSDVTNKTLELNKNEHTTIPDITASTDDLIPVKWPIETKDPSLSDPQQEIDDEKPLLLIPSGNSVAKVTGARLENIGGKLTGDTLGLNETEGIVEADKGQIVEKISPETSEDDNPVTETNNGYLGNGYNDIMDIIDNGEPNSTKNIYVRKHLKKKYGEKGNNLPVIREELNFSGTGRGDVIGTKDVISKNDVINEDAMTSKELVSREEVRSKARQDARLSALRGQIAADKAAWSCVVRYPRRATSEPNSGSSSPLTYGVNFGVKKTSPLEFHREKSNMFPLNGGKKLAIYRHNFGQKYRLTNNPSPTLPPLMTSPPSDVNLVTQRRSGVWMPDLSVVSKEKRYRVKTKSSGIVSHENIR